MKNLDEYDLGYRLLRTAWGKGFATEAAKYTLEYGFTKLGLDMITGRAHIENIASIKVLEKAGMIFQREELVDNCPVRMYMIKKQQSSMYPSLPL